MTRDAGTDRAEQAFRDAFADHLGDPLPEVMVGQRRRPRWPWLWAAVAAVVLVVVLAVARPGTFSALLAPAAPSEGQATRSAASLPSDLSTFPVPVAFAALPAPEPGWRWVSARDVAAQVPAAWVDRRVTDWCAAEVPTTPFVDTWTGDGNPAYGCGKALPAFVGVHPVSDQTSFGVEGPGQSWSRDMGSVTLSVWTPGSTDQGIGQKILMSMRLITEDARGCAVQTAAVTSQHTSGPTPTTDLATLTGVDSAVLCQYQKGTGSTLLTSSVIGGQKLTDLVSALRAAPPEGPHCALYYLGTDVRVLRLHTAAGIREVFVYPNGCNENYLTAGATPRELTSAVCQALGVAPTANGGCTKS